MQTMTTTASMVRQSLKRKKSLTDDDYYWISHAETSATKPKRRRQRCESLENGFADLRLSTSRPNLQSVPLHSTTNLDIRISPPVINPSSVDEPADVKMGISSSYEPEKDRECYA
jgi:hypothetical protein